MSILTTTHSGVEAIPITCITTITGELIKNGYSYDTFSNCWKCDTMSNMPHLILQKNSFSWQTCVFTIYVYNEISRAYTTSYTIISMLDLLNFIKDLKQYVNTQHDKIRL